MFEQLTPEFFDTLIVVVIILGLALAAVRLYADFTRPLPDERSTRSTTPSESSTE
jgi:hypothetical protein